MVPQSRRCKSKSDVFYEQRQDQPHIALVLCPCLGLKQEDAGVGWFASGKCPKLTRRAGWSDELICVF